jgi:hypothetical protein
MAGSLGVSAALTLAVVLTGVSVDAQRARAQPSKAPAKGKATAASAPKVDVSVVGLKIVGQPVGPSEYGELTAFGSNSGVEVALGVRVPDGYVLLDVDDDESTLDAMADDQGTDLVADASFDFSPDFTKERDGLITSVRVRSVPAAEARAFTLKGTLAVQTAQGEQASRTTKVSLIKGQTVKAGGAAYAIQEVETDGDDVTVTFGLTRTELDRIKEVRFLDAAGAPLEARQIMRGYSMDDAEMTYGVTSPPKVVTIEVVRHQHLMTQQVPFSFTVALGTVK